MGLLSILGLKPARQTATAGGPPTGGSAGAQGDSGTAAPVDKFAVTFASARKGMQALVDALKKHPQASRITAQIANAEGALGQADAAAAGKDYPKAGMLLANVKSICETARKLADDWAAYLAERSKALALAMSFGSADFNWQAWANPILAAADNLANAGNFAAATKKLQDELTKVGQPIIQSGIDLAAGKLTLIQKTTKAAQDYMKPEIDAGKAALDGARAALAAGEWSLAQQHSATALRLLGPAERACGRRAGYETQRAATVAAIDTVRAEPRLKAQAGRLGQRLAEADALAAHDSMKIEAGLAVLRATLGEATRWAAAAPLVVTHETERAGAEADLATLDAHVAKAKVQAPRDAARKALVAAQAAATAAATAADPSAAWNGVLAQIARVRADLTAALSLADSLATSVAAEAAAAKPGSLAHLIAAVETLKSDGEVAAKAPHADAAKAEFAEHAKQIAAAGKALTAKNAAAAAKALAAAAKSLEAAKALQAAHARFVIDLAATEASLKALKESKRAVAIKAAIDPVAAAIAEAKAKDDAHQGAEAIAALRRAGDAAAAARRADADREAFDAQAAAVAQRIAKVADDTEKKALQALATAATAQADALAFADARKALDAIDLRIDKGKLDALMKAPAPDAAEMAKLAKKMTGEGGAATIDAMIEALPDGSNPALLNALAEGRYGVKFTNKPPLPAVAATATAPAIPAGDPVKAMREVCKMFAKIPQDVVDHPSVKGVEYEDKIGSAGGSFSYDDAKVRMVGRPGIPQKFGHAQKNKDPKTGTWVDQLPPAIDPDCEPKDATAVEYLGFAAAHEVGHAVDDAQGFMQRNGGKPEFGGWISHGGDVQPIADAVGADPRFAAFYKTAEQKQYVLNKLMSKPAVAPAATPGSAADTARIAFDNWHAMATASNVYRRQGDCDAIKIGDRIYQEAYSRQWVSYLADARKKALTGYQFRAPGEWFAELYAGYRSGKLKDTHPAMSWLKKL